MPQGGVDGAERFEIVAQGFFHHDARRFTVLAESRLAEPVGAIVGYAILMPFLTDAILYGLLAFVAGIMVYISIDELLPLAHRYGEEHVVLVGLVMGMLIMAASLLMLARA